MPMNPLASVLHFLVTSPAGRTRSAWTRTFLMAAMLVGSGLAALAASPAATAGVEVETFEWTAFLGPFHIVILHFPIGFLAAASLVEIYRHRRPTPELRGAVRLLLWLSLGTGLAAVASGLLRAESGEFDAATVNLHRGFAFALIAAIVFALGLDSFAQISPRPARLIAAYRGFILLALALVTGAGHFGGSLTHGSEFLTENAPPALARLLRNKAAAPKSSTAGPASPDALYAATIRPLFESKCYSCHGPEKHKGDFRLDLKADAFRGGESGQPGIVPGEPQKSSVLRMTMLPRDHDDAMPPGGKPGLTGEEVLTLAHWIQSGASWPDESPAGASTSTNAPAPAAR